MTTRATAMRTSVTTRFDDVGSHSTDAEQSCVPADLSRHAASSSANTSPPSPILSLSQVSSKMQTSSDAVAGLLAREATSVAVQAIPAEQNPALNSSSATRGVRVSNEAGQKGMLGDATSAVGRVAQIPVLHARALCLVHAHVAFGQSRDRRDDMHEHACHEKQHCFCPQHWGGEKGVSATAPAAAL